MSKRRQHTAIIYDKQGRVLAIGQNSYIKTHPLQAHHAKRVGKEEAVFLHAEIHAITRCPDLSKAHKIQIFRYRKGKPALSAPCPICVDAIKATPIKVIEHT